MLLNIYPISFTVCLVALIAWFYFKNNPTLSKICGIGFFGGLATYLLSVYLVDAEMSYKLMIIARDLAIIGGVGYFFGMIAKNKLVFFAFLALLYGALQYKFTDVLKNTFAQKITCDFPVSGNTDDNSIELLVELKPGHGIESLKDLANGYGLKLNMAFSPADGAITDLDDYITVDIPKKELVATDNIVSLLERHPSVEWVEQNDVYQLDVMETIPQKRAPRDLKKFGLNDPNLKDLWGFQEMNVDALYAYLKKNKITPKKKAHIFILDTGVDAQHEDIRDNYKSLNKTDDKDPMGHGTHCAGIAAAVSNNGVGVASFSQNNEFVQVTSIKVLSAHGGGTQQRILKGIIKAADNGADVISMSLGGRTGDKGQKAYQQAIEYANKKGAIVIAAAGNSNDNAKFYSPANAPGAITVSALDPDLNRAAFSNYIQEVDYGISAPGVNIYSSIPGNKYASFNGTSMATPYVAGLVGLMKSIRPDLTTKQAHDILKKTGDKTGNTIETGAFIQPAKAVKAVVEMNKKGIRLKRLLGSSLLLPATPNI